MPAFSYSSSWTDICNQALARLGVSLISNVATDSTQSAVYCRSFLGEAIDAVLGAFDWKALAKRTQLAASITSPAYGFDYQYPLPSDCVRVTHVECGGGEYSIEGGNLLTSEVDVYITYVARPADPGDIPVPLRRAIQGQLALLLSLPMTSAEATAARVAQLAQADLQAAIATEGERTQRDTISEELGFTWNDELRAF